MKTMKTFTTRPSDVNSEWHVFDATDEILGRLATKVSKLLQGKHRPLYAKNIITGDHVVIINAAKIRVTGKKLDQKIYYRHSNYPGALRQIPLSRMRQEQPDKVIRSAVKGMLPKTILGREMLGRLKIYAGESHPHGAQIKEFARPELQVFSDFVETEETRANTPESPVDQLDVETEETRANTPESPVDQLDVETEETRANTPESPVDQLDVETEETKEGK